MFHSIRPVQSFKPIRQWIKDLLPEPDPNIVNRLISYYNNTNYSIRLPFATTPQQSYYDLEDVKFFARILTMLKDLGIFPPPILKSQGGPSKIIGSTFDGPLLITPNGNSSARFLNVPNSEIEMKGNVLSREAGGLADGAEGLVPEVEYAGREQVIELMDLWRVSREPLNTGQVDNEDEFESPRGSVDLDQFDDIDLNDYLDERSSIPRPNEPIQEFIEEEPEMNIIRRASTWSQRIRNRLPWTRLSRNRQNEIELELFPAFVISNEDLELGNLPPPESSVVFFRNLSPAERQRRYNYIKLVASYLLIPIVFIFGSNALIQKKLESQLQDDLILLYYKLPLTNWFRANFTALDWAYVIGITDRPLNYLFIGQVIAGVPNFYEDCIVLWVIQKYLSEQNDMMATTWFLLLRDAILFRGKNQDLIKQVVMSTLFTGFEWSYILQACASPQIIKGFLESKLSPTQELIKRAKQDIKYESKTTQRTENFDYLIINMKSILETSTNFYNQWIKDMNKLFLQSYFFETFSKNNFDIVLKDVCIRPDLYKPKAQQILKDFLKRFRGKAGNGGIAPFSTIDSEMKFVEDPSPFIINLIQACDNYYNDHGLDQLTYNWYNNKDEKFFDSFSDCLQNLPLPKNYPKDQTLRILSSVYWDLFGFLEKIKSDLKHGNEELPSVYLYNNGADPNMYFQNRQIQSRNRTLLDDSKSLVLASVDSLSIVRTPLYFLTVIKNTLVAGLETFWENSRIFTYLVFNVKDENVTSVNIYQKPVELTMTQNGMSNAGHVLVQDVWISREMDVILGVGLTFGTIVLTDYIFGMDIGVPIAKYSYDLAKTTIIAYSQLNFKQQVIVGGVTALTIVYGPKKVIEKTVEIGENIVNAGPGFTIFAIGVLGSGLIYYSSKRAKLF